MFRPEKMILLNIGVLDQDVDRAAEQIIRLNLFHLINIESVHSLEGVRSINFDEQIHEIAAIEKDIDSICNKISVNLHKTEFDEGVKLISQDKINDIKARIGEILEEINKINSQKLNLESEKKNLENILSQLKMIIPISNFNESESFSFLFTATGEIEEKNFRIIENGLKGIPSIVLPFQKHDDKIFIFVVAMKKDSDYVKKVLKESLFTESEGGILDKGVNEDTKSELIKKINNLNEKIKVIDSQIIELKERELDFLKNSLKEVEFFRLFLKVKSSFKKTDRTYLFSGWVPIKRKKKIVRTINEATSNRCYIEDIKPEEVDNNQVPVKLENPFFLKPFEMLLRNYGVPEYNTLDPTIIVAITFLFMFGMMFGDIGHGAVLLILGILLMSRKTSKGSFLKSAGLLIVYCGISSMIFGFIFGSVFGLEDLLPHYKFMIKPMDNITYMIKIVIYFGIITISLGILFNIINAIKRKKILDGIFQKTGLIGGVIYWGGIIIITRLLFNKQPVRKEIFLLMIILPVILLFFKAPIKRLFSKNAQLKNEKMFKDGLFVYIIETFIELFEIFINYLANTMSFIRVAAFGLAHVALFIALFSLVDIVKHAPGGLVISAFILVIGNILIILLEGMIVMIQSIRLEYYEFFGKFYSGEGKVYKPVNYRRSK